MTIGFRVAARIGDSEAYLRSFAIARTRPEVPRRRGHFSTVCEIEAHLAGASATTPANAAHRGANPATLMRSLNAQEANRLP